MQKPNAIRLAIVSGFVGAVTLVFSHSRYSRLQCRMHRQPQLLQKESGVAPVMQVRRRAKLI